MEEKNDQLKSTSVNRPLLIDQLDKMHADAVVLYFSGCSYLTIANELKVKRQTVAKWFMWNGICKPAYDELIKIDRKRNRKRIEKTMEELKSLLPGSIDALRKAIVSGSWEAGLSVLDRTGYGTTQKIETIDPVTEIVVKIIKPDEQVGDGSDTSVSEDTGSDAGI